MTKGTGKSFKQQDLFILDYGFYSTTKNVHSLYKIYTDTTTLTGIFAIPGSNVPLSVTA